MKLLTLTIDYPPSKGGVARYTEAVCRAFSEQMEVIVGEAHEELGIRNEDIVTRRRLFRSRWPKWWPMVGLLRSHDADIVMTHHVLPIGVACMLSKKPYIVFLHGMDFDLAIKSVWKRWLARRVLRLAHTVVTTTRFLGNRVQAFAGIEPIVVPPMPGIRGGGANDRAASDRVRLLGVGRFVERKGFQRVMDVLGQDVSLRDRVQYDVYGGDGPHLAPLQERIKQYDFDNVRLHVDAMDEEIAAAYAASDIFVMPTIVKSGDREGFGIVYLEAASFGVPSIASKLGGVDEAVVDGETGILVSSDDELKEAIARLVNDVQECQRLGQAAQERVASDFVPDVVFAPLKERLGL